MVRSWLIDPKLADIQLAKAVSSRRNKENWNGRDWYVSLGVGPMRDWEDCRKYGFISAGGGKWYSNTLNLLTNRSKSFCLYPPKGVCGSWGSNK